MKYRFEVKRPKAGDSSNEVNKMSECLLEGGTVHWGKNGFVKGFTQPLNDDGTPAKELGYINMLIEAPIWDYLRDLLRLSKSTMVIKGWPTMAKGERNEYYEER